jgi:hypothetical protein
MGNPKVVVGRLLDNRLLFSPIRVSKATDWLKLLDFDELAEFTTDLLTLVAQIADEKKDVTLLIRFLDEWRETALLSQETDVLLDIAEAEKELNAGGGKEWAIIKKEIGL